MRVTCFFQEIGRNVRLERTRTHPAGRSDTDMFFDDLGALMDRARFVMLPHWPQQLGIGAAMTENVIAARFDLFDELRVMVANTAVQENRRRQFQIVQDFEQAPISDPVAVIAPGEVACGLLAAAIGRIHPDPGAEREMFDVQRHIERQPLPVRPGVVWPVDDRRIGIARMTWKLQHHLFSALRADASNR